MGGTDSSPRRQWRCRALGIQDYTVTYTINSWGYRCAEFDTVDWKQCIAVIGCSFVFGTGLREEDTLPCVLSRELGLPVINLGVQGASNARIHRLTNLIPPVRATVCAWSFAHRFDFAHDGVYTSIATEPAWVKRSVGSHYGRLEAEYHAWMSRDDHLSVTAGYIADTPPGTVHTSIAEPSVARLCGVVWEQPNRWDVCRDGWHPSAARIRRWSSTVLPELESVL